MYDVDSEYLETEDARVLIFHHEAQGISLMVPRNGYGMIHVRQHPDGAEIERYYGLEPALDHAAELLDIPPNAIRIPDQAADMGV